jgi:dTDP-glucose 4,6-dehydratase
MRILITGGAGFLGSHLGDALLGEGNNVVCVDNLLTGRATNLRHLQNEPRFEFYDHDIREPFDFGHVDYIFAFASAASPQDYMEWGIETLLTGSTGIQNCLDWHVSTMLSFFLLQRRNVMEIR